MTIGFNEQSEVYMGSVRLGNTGGRDFVRSAIAGALAEGGYTTAVNYGRSRWGIEISKAAVPAATFGDLGDIDLQAVDFFNLVRERSIIGRMPGIRSVPFETVLVEVTAGTTAAFFAEGNAIPVSGFDFDAGGLPIRTYGGLTVASKDSLRADNFENTIRDDLLRAAIDAVDSTFIDPNNAGVADVIPPSITNGVTPVAATADPQADITALVGDFDGDLGAAFLITTPALAVALHGAGYEGAGARGGEVAGIPLITSRNVPDGVIVLADAAGIQLAWEAGVITSSNSTTLQMDDDPNMSSATPTGTNVVSLFDTNTIAFRVVGNANWSVRRAGSVSLVTGAEY
ncbi:hypothetical protein [Microbulbifer halophilus]|uniref:Phage major capsid protein n=1 Tax=Microbulbifer halophilus TaxID=453963 RepID=A0ABW5EH11_9GAMM|nr:hypothetical protein [Microbulbifer halophilus]MCW8125769.1 hypothetical protein [Microbulbifer halophilus]